MYMQFYTYLCNFKVVEVFNMCRSVYTLRNSGATLKTIITLPHGQVVSKIMVLGVTPEFFLYFISHAFQLIEAHYQHLFSVCWN